MSEWRPMKMADVMAEFYDGPHATPPPADDGPVYLGIKNLTDSGALDLSEVRHIAEEDFVRWTKRVTPEAGDIVFTYEATLHRYALISGGFRGCLGRRLALIRPDRSVVNPRYLHLAMLGPEWRATVSERIISGSTVDRIPITTFPEFPISLPPLPVQERIAGMLGSIDDLIDNNRRRVGMLEEMARAIYRDWFVHFRFPGHENATFVDSELGPIPDGWGPVDLGSVASADRSTVHPKDEPNTVFAHYSIPAFDDGRLPIQEAGASIKSGKYAIREPAVMVSKLNPRIPRTWYVEPSGKSPSVASTEFVILRPRHGRSLAWIYATVTSSQFERRLAQLSAGTSGSHQRLRPAEMLAVAVLDPPAELVERCSRALEPLLSLAHRLRSQSRNLGRMRELVLPRLVTGQIDVSELDLEGAGA